MLLVYKGDKIKEYIAGVVFKRDRPREVNLAAMDAAQRTLIEGHKDIREAISKDEAKAKSDIEIVLDTADYEPPRGHAVPVARKVSKKGRK